MKPESGPAHLDNQNWISDNCIQCGCSRSIAAMAYAVNKKDLMKHVLGEEMRFQVVDLDLMPTTVNMPKYLKKTPLYDLGRYFPDYFHDTERVQSITRLPVGNTKVLDYAMACPHDDGVMRQGQVR